jgi:hypothetical protein
MTGSPGHLSVLYSLSGPVSDEDIDWMTDQVVMLLTDPMVPTRGEAVLDLTMTTNQLNSKADVGPTVEESLACGSDHEPILTSILGTRACGGKGRYNLERMDQEKFNAICEMEAAGGRAGIGPCGRAGERCRTVNRLAERDVLLLALKGSTTRSSGRGTGQRWWNKGCGEAVASIIVREEHGSATGTMTP